METAGQEVGKIETRLRQIGTRLDRLVAKADAVGAEVRTDYRNQIEHAKEKQTAVRDKLNAYRASSGQKWDNFKGGVESAWHELEEAFKALKH
jgi:septation ring formation regulator EzrA